MNSKLRTVIGILIITMGIIFMLDILEVFDADAIFSTYWPVILIILGITTVIDRNSSTFFGIVLILAGLYLQLRELDLVILNGVDLSEIILPIVIILVGIKIFLPKKTIH